MALAYGRAEATRDIDALFEPKGVVQAAVGRVARDHGLDDDRLNDAMKGFLHGEDDDRRLVLDHPALQVHVGGPRYLLAMKLRSARLERDADDIALLLDAAGSRTAEEALDLVEAAYGAGWLSVKTQLLVESLVGNRDSPKEG